MLRNGIALALCSVAGLGLTAAPCVPYVNDFATRTSGVSPSGRWMETAYAPGDLCRPYANYSFRQPYHPSDSVQDGWAMPGGYSSDAVRVTVVDDGGNPGAVVRTTKEVSGVAVVQSLNNEFKTGILRVSVDIRTPDGGFAKNSPRAFLAPIRRAGLDLAGSALSAYAYIGPAFMSDGTSQQLRAILSVNNGSGSTTYIGRTQADNAITAGSWYRYVMTIDLDAGTYTATYADLGTAHPTPSTAGAAPKDFSGWINSVKTNVFAPTTPISDETGGIAGLALYLTNVNMPDSKPESSAVFDNISVDWKATAAAEFANVYANDFATRRYRSLGGTATGAYVASVQSATTTSASYGHGTYKNVYGVSEDSCQRLVPDAVGPSGSLEPMGVDGWRRFDGRDMKFSLIDPSRASDGYGWDNGTVLRPTVSSNNSGRQNVHGNLVHSLGTTLTNGKVRLSFDLFAAGKWYAASDADNAWAGVFLGSALDTPYQTASNDAKVILADKWSCGAGMVGRVTKASSATTTYWMASGTETPNASFSTVDTAQGVVELPYRTRWYRIVLTADLDAKTYDVVAYWAGQKGPAMADTSFMTAENLVFAKTGRGFATAAPAKIDSVILSVWNAAAYNASTKPSDATNQVGCYPLFDSIRVCRVNDDGSDGADIYANDFERCTRTSELEAAMIGAGTDRPGADGWTARGVLPSAVYVAGGNPAVVLNGSADYSKRLLHPLGFESRRAAKMTVSADIRPPLVAAASGANVWMELGGDDYWQGNLAPASSYLDAPRIGFGFAQGFGQAKKGYGYTNLTFAVRSSRGVATVVDETFADTRRAARSWYRFKATVDTRRSVFTVQVYDQGTAQPTAEDSDGVLVATFADQPLPAFADDGMTTLGLACYGIVGSAGGDTKDPNVALLDNLRVDAASFGMSIIVR